MSFRAKVLVALIVAGGLPVLLLGGLSYRATREQVRLAVDELQLRAAAGLADRSRDYVAQALDDLQATVRYLPLAELEGEQLAAVLAVPFQQLHGVNVVALLDNRGNAVVPPVFSATPSELHEPMNEGALSTFSRQIPLQTAFEVGTVVGRPYVSNGSARVALGVRVPQADRALVVELSLREVQRRVAVLGEADGVAFAVGPEGAVLATSEPGRALSDEERAFAAGALRREAGTVGLVHGVDGAEYLVAFAPVPDLGWGVVVGRPVALAFANVERLRDTTLVWAVVALLVAGALGLVLTQGLTGPVRLLAGAVKAMAAGRYGQVPVHGADELGQLAASFNQMSDEVRRRDEEIRAFNSELQARVEQKSRELTLAQSQIERARRLTALGSFSAGFTHELNNPLTSVLGLAALLDRQARGTANAELTTPLLEQARRIARVVAELKRLADQEVWAPTRFAIQDPVLSAVEHSRDEAGARGVPIAVDLPGGPLYLLGSAAELQRAVENLVRNALIATPRGGQVRISVGALGSEAVRLEVSDDGRGIPPELAERIFDPFFSTKAEPGALGLGLSLVHTIIDAHHGQLTFVSEVGKGTTFSAVFPAAPLQPHLA